MLRKFPLYRPGELKHYVELHEIYCIYSMQDENFPLNFVPKYDRPSVNHTRNDEPDHAKLDRKEPDHMEPNQVALRWNILKKHNLLFIGT
jgi:hypothetical protein